MAIGTFILILDAQSSPSTIDLFEIENAMMKTTFWI